MKSSLSLENSDCVEVANLSGGEVPVRDSKDATGAVLCYKPGEWHAFVDGVHNGEFDHSSRPQDAGSALAGMKRLLGLRLTKRLNYAFNLDYGRTRRR